MSAMERGSSATVARARSGTFQVTFFVAEGSVLQQQQR